MLIRRETTADIAVIRAVTAAAFAVSPVTGEPVDGEPVEAALVDALRADHGWIPALSLVAVDPDGSVVGHVVATRARIGGSPALGLGPVSVRPDRQRGGVGSALMHAVLGAADALDEPVVVLLGHADYYPRFGFRPCGEFGIDPPVEGWRSHFQVRPLTAYDPAVRGTFAYAAPFMRL